MKYAINIKWDVDEDVKGVKLPTAIEIPENITDDDEISDYLSDITGFCHAGFDILEDCMPPKEWYDAGEVKTVAQKRYAISVREVLQRTIVVPADSLDKAIEAINGIVSADKLILDADDFNDREIEAASWLTNGEVPEDEDVSYLDHISNYFQD